MRDLIYQYLISCGHKLPWRKRARLLKELIRLNDMIWAAEHGVPIEVTYITRE